MSIENTLQAQKYMGFHPGAPRPKGDFYASPPVAVEKLLEREKFGTLTMEPCCGSGVVSKVLEAHGYSVISRDLYDWGYGEPNRDFLKDDITEVDAVITNPPFKESLAFCEKALECTKARKGKVALLCRLQWLEGIRRKKLFESSPFKKTWVFSKRIPRMHRFGFEGEPGTTLLCFAWFVWDWTYQGEPTLGWII